MGLENMKKLAQCIIHFEAALEALLPDERRGNLYAHSNWIDNRWFAAPFVTREAAMDAIGNCASQNDLIKLMCPDPQERYFAWNFLALNKFGTIEYRKGGASLTADMAVAWGQLVLLFVQSALQVKRDSLKTMPASIGGLKEFLGAEKLEELKPLMDGKNEEESVQPTLLLWRDGDVKAMLKEKLEVDARRQRELVRDRQREAE